MNPFGYFDEETLDDVFDDLFDRYDFASKKENLKCNQPKAEIHNGKSHVVKACENGKQKLIRFGQAGVKGSPYKKGESEAARKRRKAFRDRHGKNIAKGKMSAAFWSNRVKW
jgi:hypothetical protein